jgi:hypothetical protein
MNNNICHIPLNEAIAYLGLHYFVKGNTSVGAAYPKNLWVLALRLNLLQNSGQ